MAFPPISVYPHSIDSNYELFLVHNTAEARTTKDNAAWSEEVEIVPVLPDKPEIWADNGFANIAGELFYYDSVEKNADGKVCKLKGCARNLGGTHTHANLKGTWIRGFVVAEHHNQIVNAILNVENFVGQNYDERTMTLDWRIRHLEALEVIFDDYSCPDVTFTINVVEKDPVAGTLISFLVELQNPNAAYVNTTSGYRLDFGDGDYTTSVLTGYHRYAVNAAIDPVVTITNDKCQLIQTPVERQNPTLPPLATEAPLTFPVPNIPVPHFTYVPCEVPPMDVWQPPLVLPCASITETTPQMSFVVIEQPPAPSVTINIPNTQPSIVFVEYFGSITLNPPIPPTIVIVPESNIQLQLDMMNLPKIEVDWGAPPAMEVALTMPMQPKTTLRDSTDNEFGAEFADIFQAEQHVKVAYEPVGIPSEIQILPPSGMPKVEFDTSTFPTSVKVEVAEVKLPNIEVVLRDPIPEQITLEGVDRIPSLIEVVCRDIPTTIELVTQTEFPNKIDVEFSGPPIPERIIIEAVTPIPERIILEAVGIPDKLQVVGIPDHLPVTGFPDSIPLVMPENPQIEVVLKGIETMKIDMQELLSRAGQDQPCFMLVQCNK